MPSDILCFGEALGEFNQTIPREPTYLFGFGGDTSNCAIAAARSGASVGVIGAVGDDTFGRAFMDLWRAEGIDTGAMRMPPQSETGIYFITHGPDGHEFAYRRAGSAAARFTSADLPVTAIRAAKILHVSGISQAISPSASAAVRLAIAEARAAGVTVSYDTNLRLRLWPLERAREVTNEAMRLADIALPGLDDARQLTGRDTPDAIADFYLDGGSKIVALTLGKDGALIATAEERRIIPSIPVGAVDATGAGDCFDGAFLAEWLATGDPFRAGRYACAAAALSTRGYGAVAPLPRRDEVLAVLG
ncbi:sugar kinase [Phreatobacter cathodiphilus]|uniref:2-dehydro-3-deoxygluconokinase n=1 Tax=Phreatobacter cathodiphilus TaxID=1868589 RepID=A0A2S0NH37_9HYPH|nr:sugar kinase [Phreatobacter cathodiphilus]AVO47489.1 2-dehydro-3-deoxygluconokinase [Phreatobacter cathodiphilus]